MRVCHLSNQFPVPASGRQRSFRRLLRVVSLLSLSAPLTATPPPPHSTPPALLILPTIYIVKSFYNCFIGSLLQSHFQAKYCIREIKFESLWLEIGKEMEVGALYFCVETNLEGIYSYPFIQRFHICLGFYFSI